jgi:hypothetical protein
MLVSAGSNGSGLKLSFLGKGVGHPTFAFVAHHSTITGYFFDLLK